MSILILYCAILYYILSIEIWIYSQKLTKRLKKVLLQEKFVLICINLVECCSTPWCKNGSWTKPIENHWSTLYIDWNWNERSALSLSDSLCFASCFRAGMVCRFECSTFSIELYSLLSLSSSPLLSLSPSLSLLFFSLSLLSSLSLSLSFFLSSLSSSLFFLCVCEQKRKTWRGMLISIT